MKRAEEVPELWGWGKDGDGEWFRAPLPVLAEYGRKEVNLGSFGRFQMPPYVTAHPDMFGGPELLICESDGYRAGYNRVWGDASNCLYADDMDALPEEWMAPVEAAVAEVSARWPNVRFRHPPDTDLAQTLPLKR